MANIDPEALKILFCKRVEEVVINKEYGNIHITFEKGKFSQILDTDSKINLTMEDVKREG